MPSHPVNSMGSLDGNLGRSATLLVRVAAEADCSTNRRIEVVVTTVATKGSIVSTPGGCDRPQPRAP